MRSRDLCGGRWGRGGANQAWLPASRSILRLAVLFPVLLLAPQLASGLTVDFEDVPGLPPTTAEEVVPGGPFGPELDLGGIALDGGIIALAISPADLAATSGSNFYVTTDFMPLADGSLLLGEISATLASAASSITLDVGNGNLFASTFTLTAYSGTAVVASDSIPLGAFASPGGFVGSLSVSGPAITGFKIASDQPDGFKLFSIDTIGIVSVPEPSLVAIIAAGALAMLRFVQACQRRS